MPIPEHLASERLSLPFPGRWIDDALCLTEGYPDLWHSPDPMDMREAKSICGRCPVQVACLTYYLRVPMAHDHGIAGGTTPQERAAMRRRHVA